MHARIRNVMPLALALLAFASPLLAAEPPEGFTALFNGSGKDLSGWWGADTENPAKYMAMSPEDFAKKRGASLENIMQHWSVQGDELVNDGGGLYLTTDKYYGDFELLVDYKTVAKADSGIYLRGTPQVQIWDYTKEGGKWNLGADKGSGGLWNNSAGAAGKDPLVLADKPFGEWNHFRIVMVGSRVTVWLNDKLVVDHVRMENYYDRKIPIQKTGPIQLQTHGGEIRWRNIFIREIGPEEANTILRNGGPDKKPDTSFKSIFDGKDFEGWKGPVDNYEVKDSAVKCKPGHGGTIYYDEEYSDFAAKMEINIPDNGNNGLAIRYPGSGDTAYVGMCELQVLDDDYKGIDPRQAHGSAYGMVAAHRGFQRPNGVWNYEQITIKGSTIQVELNGFLILDCDLSKVKEFMANSKHPGKDRKSGYFGFAGHNDPVRFRNIEVKKLD
jgi:3-keto-disaccharide hydrolase